MNNQRKKLYFDRLQKLVTKTCWNQCKTDSQCIQTCYQNLLGTINIEAYNNFSQIAFKGYPEDRIDHLYLKTPLFRWNTGPSYGVKNESGV